jgi:hypothetical protein
MPTVRALIVTLGAVSVASAQIAPPANDNFANALTVLGESFQLSADLAGATLEPFERTIGSHFGRTAWWRWTAPASGVYEWDASASPKPVALTVFTEDTLGQMTLESVSTVTGSFQANEGEGYWIQADAAFVVALAPGGFPPFVFPPSRTNPYPAVVTVRPAPPAPENDDFANRTPLVGTNVVFGGSLRSATAEPGEPRLPGDVLHRTRWWTWTAPGRGSARIESKGTGAAPVIGVYQIGALFDLELVANSSTEFGNECISYWQGRTNLDFDTEAGAVYELQLDRYPVADPAVGYQLELTFTPAPSNDDLVHALPLAGTDLALTVDNFGATANPDDPVLPNQTGAGSVWFQWTPPVLGILQVTTNAPLRFGDPSFVVLPSAGTWDYGSSFITTSWPCAAPFGDLHPLPPFSPVFGIYDVVSSVPGQTVLNLLAFGTNTAVAEVRRETRIQLDGNAGISGSTAMNLLFTPPPTNDNFAQRILLPSQSVQVGGRTFAATAEARDPQPGRSVWWEWTAPVSGLWVFRPLTGAGDEWFSLVHGADTRTTDGVALVFSAAANDVFEVAVSAKTGFGDNIGFSLQEASAPPLSIGLGAGDGGGFTVQISWPAAFDLPFVFETSPDLADWQPAGPGLVIGDTSATENVAADGRRRFYRMRINAP